VHHPREQGRNGFVWDGPVTGDQVYRPGSGVVAGYGTAANPYVIEGWCISGADWGPPGIAIGTCNFGFDGPPIHESEETELARDLSLFDITMIGVGAMIGAGIFGPAGLATGEAGPALVTAFAFNGLITISTGMVYAELGSAIREAGGGYLWDRQA
jgi:hypothetical protein